MEEMLKPGCRECPVVSNALLRNLLEEQVARFTCIFRPSHYRRNQVLFFEGGAAQHLFSLRSGLVKMVKSLENGKERIIRIFFPGDMFGLEALSRATYTLTAIVIQDSEICAVPPDQFFAFLRANPDISLDMIRILLNEITQARTQMTTMSFKDARTRVATFVLSLMSSNQVESAKSCFLTLPFTSQEIGEILELSPETVSRAWNALRREGLVEKRGRNLVIQNLQGLEGAAQR